MHARVAKYTPQLAERRIITTHTVSTSSLPIPSSVSYSQPFASTIPLKAFWLKSLLPRPHVQWPSLCLHASSPLGSIPQAQPSLREMLSPLGFQGALPPGLPLPSLRSPCCSSSTGPPEAGTSYHPDTSRLLGSIFFLQVAFLLIFINNPLLCSLD